MSKELLKLKKAELLELAASKRVKVAASMKKEEIVSALKKAATVAVSKSAAPKVKSGAAARPAAARKGAPAAKKGAAAGKAEAVKKAAPAVKKAVKAAPKEPAPVKPAAAAVKISPKPAPKPAAAPAAKKAVAVTQKPLAPSAAPKSAPAAVRAPSPGAEARKVKNWDINLEEKKFFVADEIEDFPRGEPGELPERYGDNRIVALARAPRSIYVYWETNSALVEKARGALGGLSWDRIRWVLRVFDVTGIDFNGKSASRVFDVVTGEGAGSSYIDVGQPDREYIVSIGLMDDEGRFEPVATSGRTRTPRAAVSETAVMEWGVPREAFDRISGVTGGRAGASSLEFGASELAMGASEMMIPPEVISSGAVSSFAASEEFVKAVRERGFFFWLNCELVVYGGTAPDAAVTMMGERVKLRPDGTFTVRMSLPDGVIDIPVIARSADGKEKREISPTVTRATRLNEEKEE